MADPDAFTGYELFQAALEEPEARRQAFVEFACGKDAVLRGEVESLLAADAAVGSFLDVSREPHSAETKTFNTGVTGTISSRAARELTGRELSHYRITARLGAGGMGEVYLAEDLALGKPAALKLLRQDLPAALQDRLLREGDANARLQHPAIATFFESGMADDVAFIAMEYVEGVSLCERLSHGPFSPQEVAALGCKLLEAVAHAHDAGVVHGDIKPSTDPRTNYIPRCRRTGWR